LFVSVLNLKDSLTKLDMVERVDVRMRAAYLPKVTSHELRTVSVMSPIRRFREMEDDAPSHLLGELLRLAPIASQEKNLIVLCNDMGKRKILP